MRIAIHSSSQEKNDEPVHVASFAPLVESPKDTYSLKAAIIYPKLIVIYYIS